MTPGELAHHRYWTQGDLALLRLHIDLEAPADIIADLKQALDAASV